MIIGVNDIFQEYFGSSAYPEGLNGSSYYGQLPAQQAHSTTPHEAPHSVSVTTGAGPGAGLPPTGPISMPASGLPSAPIVRDLPIRAPADIPKSIGKFRLSHDNPLFLSMLTLSFYFQYDSSFKKPINEVG